MARTLAAVVLLACFCVLVDGYTYMIPVETKGYCKLEDGTTLNVGETHTSEEPCEAYDCTEGYIQGRGCGVMSIDIPNCHLEKGKGQYPNCCQQVVCDDDYSYSDESESDGETQS